MLTQIAERPARDVDANPAAGTVAANGTIVPVADGDRSCLLSSSGGNLIVDRNVWWVP